MRSATFDTAQRDYGGFYAPSDSGFLAAFMRPYNDQQIYNIKTTIQCLAYKHLLT